MLNIAQCTMHTAQCTCTVYTTGAWYTTHRMHSSQPLAHLLLKLSQLQPTARLASIPSHPILSSKFNLILPSLSLNPSSYNRELLSSDFSSTKYFSIVYGYLRIIEPCDHLKKTRKSAAFVRVFPIARGAPIRSGAFGQGMGKQC